MHEKFEHYNKNTRKYSCLEITDEGIRVDVESQRAFFPYGSFYEASIKSRAFHVSPNPPISSDKAPSIYIAANKEERNQISALIDTINELNAKAEKTSYRFSKVNNSKAKEQCMSSNNNNATKSGSSATNMSSNNKKGTNSGSSSAKKNESNTKPAIIIAIIITIIVLFLHSGGCTNDDIAYDSNGVGGMSDGFWEWWIDR